MQPVQKFFGHLLLPSLVLLPSLKVNKRIVDATCTKFIGHLLLPSLKVNKRIVDATCTKVLWSLLLPSLKVNKRIVDATCIQSSLVTFCYLLSR